MLLLGGNIDTNALSVVGISKVYRATRIQVGNPPLHKINFTPAQRIA